MTNLPGGWSEHKLGRYADFIRGVTYKKPDASSSASEDRVPLLRATNFDQGQLALEDLLYVPDALIKPVQYLREGDTLLATSSGSISVVGKAVYIDHISTATTFGAFCGVLRPSLEVSPKLLYYFCCSPSTRSKWSEVASGTNINNLKPRDIEATAIPTPLIDEQDEIVRILDTQLARLDTVSGAVQAVREKAAQFRRSLLRDAFNGQLTKPDPSRGGDLPNGWMLVTLGDLVDDKSDIVDGPFGSNLKSAHYTDDGALVVRLQNIGFGEFLDAEAFISLEHFATLQRHQVLPGDLLFASLGERLPRACIAPSLERPAIVKADCIRVRLASRVNSTYVMWATQRPAARAWAEDSLHGMGRPRLGLRNIRDFPVPLPSRREQDESVRILDAQLVRLDAVLAAADRVEAQCSRLRRSLLQAAFSGELTRDWRESRV